MTYLDPSSFTHKFVRLGGFQYHYVEEGPQGGEPLLLVHGFPDLWYGWRHQIRFLAQRGFRVYAIDTLGYGQTDSPSAVEHYTLKNLASHLVAFIDHLQLDKVTLLGHDWGGMLVWRTALYFPSRIKGVVSVSTPYLPPNTTHDTLEKVVAETPEFAYQLTFAKHETTAKMNRRSDRVLGNVAQTGKLSQTELDYYLAQYARSGFQGPLNYYRTTALNFRDESDFVAAANKAAKATTMDASVPCVHIITTRDQILTPALAHHGPRHIPTLLVREIDADHFALSEKPDEINAMLADVLENFILPRATTTHSTSVGRPRTEKPIKASL